MQQILNTPQGPIAYTFTRKKVRNLNLRVRIDGSVVLSAPLRMPQREIDRFLAEKTAWICKTRTKLLQNQPTAPCRYSREECLQLFSAVSDSIYPLFADLLGGEKPTLRVREMKTRWGVCNPARRTITLNMRLAEKPRAALEYVVLHEYVHFLHPNHQAGFHAEMARLMPDYRQRKKLLQSSKNTD